MRGASRCLILWSVWSTVFAIFTYEDIVSGSFWFIFDVIFLFISIYGILHNYEVINESN